jgi:hypothetical protein
MAIAQLVFFSPLSFSRRQMKNAKRSAAKRKTPESLIAQAVGGLNSILTAST